MKRIFQYSLLSLLLLACDDDDSNKNNQSDVASTVVYGTWRITFFFDTDIDETDNFTGYAFTFGAANVLTATKGGTIQRGSWSVTDSHTNDDSLDDLDFNIAFTSPNDFEELSEDWSILEYTSTQIKLIHVSGGNGGTDYLTFEKN